MKCRTCDKTFYLSGMKNNDSRRIAEELHVCGTCQWKIRQNKTKLSDDKAHVTYCVLCKKQCDRYSITPTCGANKCRAKWYRIQNDINLIRQCIIKNDFTEIHHMTVKNILELDFTLSVRELPAHMSQVLVQGRKYD